MHVLAYLERERKSVTTSIHSRVHQDTCFDVLWGLKRVKRSLKFENHVAFRSLVSSGRFTYVIDQSLSNICVDFVRKPVKCYA